MAYDVRYSFLWLIICLRITLCAHSILQVTTLIGVVGNEVIIQCATDKTSQDGVYMYKQEGTSKNEQLLFYYYKDNTFTPKSPMYKDRVRVEGVFPSLNVTFLNMSATDIGLYWCEFNLEDKITVGPFTWLWAEKSVEGEEDPTTERPQKETTKDVTILNILCVIISLLGIICFVFVVLKVKECWKNRPSNPQNVYD